MTETTDATSGETYTSTYNANDPYAGAEPEGEGRVFTVGGGDWDDVVDAIDPLDRERIVINMGPQHPSTHGVLRLVLELDGETVMQARPVDRLPAHRHREEHGVPQLDSGRHVHHPLPTTSRRCSTRRRTASASSGCSTSRTRSPSG